MCADQRERLSRTAHVSTTVEKYKAMDKIVCLLHVTQTNEKYVSELEQEVSEMKQKFEEDDIR